MQRPGNHLRPRDVVGEWLLEKQRLPGARGAHRELGLGGGCDGDRDGVTVGGEQLVGVLERGYAELRGELGRVRAGARPHAGDTCLRTGGEHRSGHRARPRSGADESHLQGSGHRNELYASPS